MRKSILVALVVLSVGCTARSVRMSRDLGESLDANPGDGGTLSDSGPSGLDGATLDDGGRRDAAMSDGSVGDGGSPAEIALICAGLCDAIGVCLGMPVDSSCAMGCMPDLADCTGAQLEVLTGCETVGCAPGPDGNPALITCVSSVACIDMAGTPPPSPPPPPPAP